jgi:Fe-Mn family superoxide dismutase
VLGVLGVSFFPLFGRGPIQRREHRRNLRLAAKRGADAQQALAHPGGGEPGGRLADAINKAFGGFAQFKDEFTKTSVGTFGSGWGWLVQRPDGGLALASTANAGTPITGADRPLLTCDVWEHAYYIDYRNARPKYVEAFWNLVNWEFAASQMS